MSRRLNPREREAISESLRETGGAIRPALRLLKTKGYDIGYGSVQQQAQHENHNTKEKITREGNGNREVITCISKTIRTLDDALTHAKVDLGKWEIDRYVIDKRDAGSKDGSGNPQVVELWQIKIWLKNKVTSPILKAIEQLTSDLKTYSPKYPSIPKAKIAVPHMMEISIYDTHFGQLAWGAETGTDYDIKIAEACYIDAVKQHIQYAKPFEIEKFLFPLGQDFFHINNAQNTTVNDTKQDIDCRLAKIYNAGVWALIKAIEMMASIAPVEVIYVPGNHDRDISYFATAGLKLCFRNNERITVDDSPKLRKYVLYGSNLIGFTHGDEEPHRDLPAIMAGERPDLWAKSKYREWHLGHLHKRKETRFNAGDTFTGVSVKVLPSISGTDAWHYRKGYVNKGRIAESYLYRKDGGMTACFLAYV